MCVVRWVRAVGFVVLGFTVLAGVPVQAQDSSMDDAQSDVAMLDPVQGLVQVRRVDEPAWQTVVEAVPVAEGDAIRTGETGLAEMVFFEGVAITILPESIVRVDRRAVVADETAEVVLNLSLGDLLSRVNAAARPIHYEVHTPSAVIAVRGTEFWVSLTLEQHTRVIAIEGDVTVIGVDDMEQRTESVVLEAGQEVTVLDSGEVGPIAEMRDLPVFPPESPLVPATCGDGKCEDGEAEICPLDCLELPDCGDGMCDRAIENAILCPEDCEPSGPAGPTLVHFYWAMMRCDTDPAGRVIHDPLIMHWGVGCFDSAAHASAHPHPADYQLTIDGQAANMSSLTQSGPHEQAPHCPWGWGFMLGPLSLGPGEHTLVLTETITDTWSSTVGDEDQGRTAGEVVTLQCTLVIARP